MRKKAAKMAALMLTAAMALTACGGSGQSTENSESGAGSSTQAAESGKDAIKDLVTYEDPKREQEGFFVLNTEKAADLNVLCNL